MLALLFAFSPDLAAAATIDPADAPSHLGLSSYEVAAGDTLLGLAERFGISAETIVWANELQDKELLKIGQKLVILPVSGVLHRVRGGDTLSGIAQAYGVEVGRLLEANRLANPELIREGLILLVPGGIKKATSPSSSPGGAPAGEGEATIKYTVKPGDTLFSIASAFKVKVSAILAANGMSNPDYLKIGQLLLIPGGQPPAAAAAAPPAPQPPSQAAPEPPPALRAASSRGEEANGRSFVATTTAYCLRGTTRSGTQVRWGIVAVDPRVIPLGSKLQIEGFEEVFVAEDTGGGVKGDWIDIWFESCAEARAFGMQSRRVTILDR